jgi:uncharacterized protein YfaS (alpha-2-macroglobulin family)
MNKLSWRTPIISTAALLLALHSLSATQPAPYSYQPADRGQISAGGDTKILPAKFLREYDPITVLFDRDMHPEGSGPLDKPEGIMSIKPMHPGEYRWLDSRTVEFKPTVAWKPLKRFTITAGKASRQLVTLLTPPSSTTPASGSRDLEKVDRVSLEFEQRVPVDILARLVTFEACPLPGIDRVNCRTYGAEGYTIKESKSGSADRYIYWFVMNQPFTQGLKVRINVRLADDPALAEGMRTYWFDTRADFTIQSAGTYDHAFTITTNGSAYGQDQAVRLNPGSKLLVEFSAPPADLGLSQVKSMINFSPAPARWDWSLSENRLSIEVAVDAERLYQCTVRPQPVHDRGGRELISKRQSSFYFYQPKDRAFVRWEKSFGLVERFGPQHFPLSARGVKSMDLRVFRIDPQHKAFWPFPDAAVDVNESILPPGPGEEPEPEDDIVRPLSGYELGAHLKMLGSPPYSAIVDLDKEGVSRFQSIDLRPIFTQISGEGKPGTYLVGYRGLDGTPTRSWVRVQVTDLCLSTVEAKDEVLFAVTSYASGKPVNGVKILIQGVRNDRFEDLINGTTDRDGFFRVHHDEALHAKLENYAFKRVVATDGDDCLILDNRGSIAPPEFFSNHWYGHRSDWLQWLSSEPYDFSQDRTVKAFVFTERPIYRPEEKVYIKGYVRHRFHGELSIPQDDAVYTLKVAGPSGDAFEYPVTLTTYGSFSHVFSEGDLATGAWEVQLTRSAPDEAVRQIASTSYAVEAYRIPTFEIKMNGPDRAANDRSFTVKLNAAYYAGGGVSGQNVHWTITSYPYTFTPAGLEGFALSTDQRYSGAAGSGEAGAVEQDGVTDETGQAQVVGNPQSAVDGNPRKYVVEATVTDIDQQTVSNRHAVLALPAFVLGVKTERHVSQGSTIRAEVVAIGVDERPIAGQRVNVQLKKMSWTSYLQETDFSRGKPKYVTQESIDLLREKEVVSAAQPVEVQFTNQESGVYIIETSARDRLGRLQTVKVDLFLAGDKPVAWKKSENLVFETVPDKKVYEPGDKAQVLLKSPFQNGLALAVVEMPGGQPEYQWIEVRDGQGTLTIEILPSMVPRLPVGFLLMRPRIADPKRLADGTQVDAGKPQTVANTTMLTVAPTANLLTVSVAHPAVVMPGTTMELTLTLKDYKGSPRPGEVALWLVDEAVLALAPEKRLDPLPNFIDPVRSAISIRDSRNLALGDLRIPEGPGGDGSEEELAEAMGKITVRKNFKTVPYYNEAIEVDKSGTVKLSIPMPDNLTNFALRAVAVSSNDRFGTTKSRVAVRLPVLVQPALPRFVRVGDRLTAGGTARVVEGEGGAGAWSIETKGLTLSAFAQAAASGTQECKLSPVKALALTTEMTVAEPGYANDGRLLYDSVEVAMKVIRASDKAGDGFKVKLPLLPDRTMVVEETFAELTGAKDFQWKALPQPSRPNTLLRTVLVTGQMPILKAIAGLSYLMRYPYDCTEQRISRALPSLAYRDIWGQWGLESPDPRLKDYVVQTLGYLGRVQTTDGLFGYWPGSTGYTYLTAYVTEFLLMVKKANTTANAGYPLDEAMLTNALGALKRSLRSDYAQFVRGYDYFERGAALKALALAGEADVAYLRQLASTTAHVDVLSQARILAAMANAKGGIESARDDLEKRLWQQTVFKLDNGKEIFGGLQQRDFRIGAEVHGSEITDIAGMISAFSAVKSNPPKVAMMVDELVGLAGQDGWGNTNVNANALLGLRDYIAAMKAEGLRADVTFTNAGTSHKLKAEGSSGVVAQTWKQDGAGSLHLEKAAADQRICVRFSQQYLPQASGSRQAATQRGFVVKRELIHVVKGTPAVKTPLDSAGMKISLNVGDIIEEHIQVQNPQAHHFAAVACPLAAGFEPLNPNLETAGEDARPSNATTNPGDYQAFLDDKVIYFFRDMPEGVFDFYYRVRATTPGEYTQPPALAELMYEQAVAGASNGARIVIKAE